MSGPTLHVLEEDEVGDLWCGTHRDEEHPYGTPWPCEVDG